MTPERFRDVVSLYQGLRIAVVGDFCLDRYLEIDPDRAEVSIETGLPVYNVVNVRAQPGGAGTVLNNLAALGVGRIEVVGFRGADGEGYELQRELELYPSVSTEHLLTAHDRRTFTYCKPLVVRPGAIPVELNRLDSKNWTPTPKLLELRLVESLRAVAARCHAIVVLEQVDAAETGVVTRGLLEAIDALTDEHPRLLFLADSRRGLRDWPGVGLKMNAAELAAMLDRPSVETPDDAKRAAGELARGSGRPVFVTLAEHGIVAAGPEGEVVHVPALPVRGPIDVVGAGDSVTANLTAALAAGASLREAVELAVVASSVVVHQVGTTGVATVDDLASLLDRIPAA
ncbi:bifunctional heptose 7-phosphate kinase/heptose 1-phosphate adenyltransferase [Planctomyces sp. SH-PL62]|uniref:bifunctional heptose 7-phosphate kinase/heptose 1-phosphate adenyltransferase n=1 Tax=Planctomyces sp. SH-PL62 TaxID=1636152 RepID=UPI00078DDDFE|nr:PfkB family carbohydrate kinase [Planctomyces sp. SH-PL62]AMV38659.1 Bifunctional protein HldE [Planctomyces sp. SH-PL62]